MKSVLNLIQKFEKLSNEISNDKHSLLRRKSIQRPIQLETPAAAPLSVRETSPVSVTSGWSHKPFLEIETRIKRLKSRIGNITHGEANTVLLVVMEIMDLLIQLGSIDTDGLKSFKIKKECCLADLREIKTDLQQLVSNERHLKLDPTEEKLCVSTESINEDVELQLATEEPIENNIIETPVPMGVVHKLTKHFETAVNSEVTSLNNKFAYEATNPSSPKAEESNYPSTPPVKPKMSLNDITSEIAYYKEIVPSLDPEDDVKIESIHEHLLDLATDAQDYIEVKEDITILLDKIKAIKSAISYHHEMENSIPNSNWTLVDQQIQCAEFLQSEQGCVFQACSSAEKETKDDGPIALNNSIQVVHIDIPGDEHLSKSILFIQRYKTKITEYLDLPNQQLLEISEPIAEHIVALDNFKPHPNLAPQYEDLRTSYKELLDFVTEAKFERIFIENINNDTDNGAIEQDSIIVNFHKLCSEVNNYYPIVERSLSASSAQKEVLKDNMMELIGEIEQCDVSFSEDLSDKKTDALQTLGELLEKL